MWDHIGIDWGTKFAGFSLGDSSTNMVIPLTKVVKLNESINLINELSQKHPIKKIVIGLATNQDYKAIKNTTKITEFGNTISKLLPDLKIEYYNERGTSKQANNTLDKAFLDNLWDSQLIHNMVAKIILDEYFEFNS